MVLFSSMVTVFKNDDATCWQFSNKHLSFKHNLTDIGGDGQFSLALLEVRWMRLV